MNLNILSKIIVDLYHNSLEEALSKMSEPNVIEAKVSFNSNLILPKRAVKILREYVGNLKANHDLSFSDGGLTTTDHMKQIQSKYPDLTYESIKQCLFVHSKYHTLEETEEVFKIMRDDLKLPMNNMLYTLLISCATRTNKFDRAQFYFDDMISRGIDPDKISLGALINSKAKANRIEDAVQLLDSLLKMNVDLSSCCYMYVPILKAYIESRKYEAAEEFWLRMHDDGLTLTKEAFTLMLQLCAYTNRSERAFFHFDEMKALNIEPDTHVFVALFRAAAEAPCWVNGFQNSLFDAMYAMEGSDLSPTTDIYNSIISGFARAGDAVSAEFYFWEMRRKNLKPDSITYNALLTAYAR